MTEQAQYLSPEFGYFLNYSFIAFAFITVHEKQSSHNRIIAIIIAMCCRLILNGVVDREHARQFRKKPSLPSSASDSREGLQLAAVQTRQLLEWQPLNSARVWQMSGQALLVQAVRVSRQVDDVVLFSQKFCLLFSR